MEAFELKFLVNKVSDYLTIELANIIPGESSFYKNFLIFSFEQFLGKPISFINEFGNQEIMNLSKYFFENNKEFSDPEIILFQCRKFKLKINEYYKNNNLSSDPIDQAFKDIFFKTDYNELLELFKIYLTLPSSNAEVERGFSCMKRIKTQLRNRMSTQLLEDLMNISLNGDKIEDWNVEESVLYWIKKNNLRSL